MRRWHEDRDLMVARQKFAARYYDTFHMDGLSRWRKRKPLDCTIARCGVCHGDKFYGAKARANKRRAAILFDLNADV